MEIFWLLIGALIGVGAAHDKGFSTALGLIGGLLLGPFAFLMFWASSGRRKCPLCAEWIRKEAKLCPYCKSDVYAASGTATDEMTLGEMKKKGLIK